MKFESQLLKGIAPVVVLEILSRGQMYGYELSQAIEQRSGEILTLGKGTLYPLLYNLEAKKLIKGKWGKTDSGRKRRYYSITSNILSGVHYEAIMCSGEPKSRAWCGGKGGGYQNNPAYNQ